MSLLFDGGTPARMAAALRDGAEAERTWTSLVPIRPGGTRAPLFCVHSYDGQVLPYRLLAHHLGPDQPVYGLQAVGLEGDEEPLADVRAMAARYVAEVRSVQPEGPYALLSICFGIAVALEMGRLLTDAGQEVSHLFVLDSSFEGAPRHAMTSDSERAASGRPESRPLRVLRRIASLDTLRELPAHLAVHGPKVLAPFQQLVTWGRQAAAGPRELREWRAFRACQQAWDAYRPAPYAGPVTLVRSSAWTNRVAKRWHIPVWAELAGGGLTVHAVPGNHEDMLTEPYVQTLAARVRASLQEDGRPRPGTDPGARSLDTA
jgi:thioesterase domain-containing protein